MRSALQAKPATIIDISIPDGNRIKSGVR